MENNRTFNGNMSCIAHRAACGLSDNIVSELVTLGRNYSIPMDKISLYTVFLYQQKYIDKRYTEDELNDYMSLLDFTCDTMRFQYGLKELCCSCSLSENYSNSHYLDEQYILSYACISTSNRNKISSLIKNKGSKVFRSKQRLGNNDTCSKYISLNNVIYKYLCSLTIIPKLHENEEFEQLADNFSQYIMNDKTISTLEPIEQGYVISYFLTIYTNSNKIKMSDLEIANSINELMSRSPLPKLVKNSSNNTNSKLQLSIYEVEASLQEIKDVKNDVNKIHDLIDNIDEIELENNDIEDIITHKADESMNQDNYKNLFYRYIQNVLTISLLKDIDNLMFIYDDKSMKALDYSILSNTVIALEIIECDSNEYCLLYLYKQNAFYVLNINDNSSLELLKFYLTNMNSLIKLTYSSLLLKNRLSINIDTNNNLYGLEMLYNIHNKTDSRIEYNLLIQLMSEIKLNDNLPILLQGMSIYKDILNKLLNEISKESLNVYRSEFIFENIVSNSLSNDNRIAQSKKMIELSYIDKGINQYSYNLAYVMQNNPNYLMISIIVQNTTLGNFEIEDIYKALCIKLYINNLITKHDIKLCSLSFDNGLKLIILRNSYAELFTLLNHWIITMIRNNYNIIPSIFIESIA